MGKEAQMLDFEIFIRSKTDRKIGTVTICLLKVGKDGKKSRYSVEYRTAGKPEVLFQAHVTHNRGDGALVLVSKATKELAEKVEEFYSVPKDKVLDLHGMMCVPADDIPQRYRKEFMEWMSGQTCMEHNGKVAIYLHDLERWLQHKRSGAHLYFD